jgi:hypothetical protein
MRNVHISIRFVDGSFQEYEQGADFLSQITALQSQGVEGKALIHELISDDWSAPPRSVEVLGEDALGNEFSIVIPYR